MMVVSLAHLELIVYAYHPYTGDVRVILASLQDVMNNDVLHHMIDLSIDPTFI